MASGVDVDFGRRSGSATEALTFTRPRLFTIGARRDALCIDLSLQRGASLPMVLALSKCQARPATRRGRYLEARAPRPADVLYQAQH